MDFRMTAFTVAATGLLAASCAGTKQDAEHSDVVNDATYDAPVERTTHVDTKFVETPFELSPQIQEACRPYRIPEPRFTLHPDSDLRRELGGLTNCLVHGPLYDRGLELVHPDPGKSYFADTVEPLRQALIDGGVEAFRLEIVSSADTDSEAAGLMLRLASADADT